ncbi:predicted protein [Thalassiosira pseudonana CCMP1335]|uniref:Bromo domain-containing protein n=1 Tax=Thalassiosira pseudonana TaxID=35128 RepID=B8BU09_THAPS|nr:predicted protein [Thalassiosira pseudonana CCMP1335]EED95199.1 predicted protein [Thalassiosira pseudonana CCMP1335]
MSNPRQPTAIISEQHKHIQHSIEHLLTDLQKREPLDSSYDSLLPAPFRKHAKASLNNKPNKSDGAEGGAKRSNVLAADVKLHRRLNANLRSIVETFASTPAGWRRRPNTRRVDIDFGSANQNDNKSKDGDDDIDTKLRAAFALRESKEHEQRDLVNATLKAENAKLRRGWGFSQANSAGGGVVGATGGQMFAAGLPPLEEAAVRKKRLEAVSKQLKDAEKGAGERVKLQLIAKKGKDLILNPKALIKSPDKAAKAPATSDDLKRKRVDSEAEKQEQIEEAKRREKKLRERVEREEAENKRRIEKEIEEQERRERALETPRDALHRLYEPIFNSLWDMEFDNLGGVNPFRTVIDAKNCAQMGAPDYCDVIKRPMNLTYIQDKVNKKSYESLQEFFEDIDLIAKNAMQYNAHPENPYHVAAKLFRKQFKKLAKPLVQSLTKGQQNN